MKFKGSSSSLRRESMRSDDSSGKNIGRALAKLSPGGMSEFVQHVAASVAGSLKRFGNAADVFFYRDSSIAPLLDMRRRFKAVMDVLDAVIRHGASLSRSVELAAPWDDILAVGPLYPVTLDDLHAVEGSGLGDFHRVVSDVHHRLSDFVRGVVVHRRDEVIRGWRDWLWEHPAP